MNDDNHISMVTVVKEINDDYFNHFSMVMVVKEIL